MNYWIFKSEPNEFGIQHLAAASDQTTRWDGIRNYQARNLLRDEIEQGDQVLFYHSSCKHTGIVGSMEVVQAGYPDPSQFDADSRYFDSKATVSNPRWFSVDVRLLKQFPHLLATKTLKADAVTAELSIFRQGRLSVAPVTAEQWQVIAGMSKQSPANA